VAEVPLNVTELAPVKFVPVTVTDVPAAPLVGLKLVMLGAPTTVKFTPLLFTPPADTTTFPVVAPDGTGATMPVLLQLVTVAVVPLNFTVLVPWLAPKFEPIIVTGAVTAPLFGVRVEMFGVPTTVKPTPLLFTPPANTTTFPVEADVGTVVAMLVALQLVTVAAVPLKVTVLAPCVDPKFVPVIVTDAPTAPLVELKLVIVGAPTTVKPLALLAMPPTVTNTFPVVAPLGTTAVMLVALQLVTVAAVPLKVTVLDPWVEPKFVPVIVTDALTAPLVGFRLVMLGALPEPDAAFSATITDAQYELLLARVMLAL
jgi:hypothetical protein